MNKFTTLVKAKLAVLALFLLCSLNSYAQVGISYDDCIQELRNSVEANDYQYGLALTKMLEEADTLPLETLLDCIKCYEELEKYDECIAFCDKYLRNHPDCHYLFFEATFGKCYYMLKNYAQAVKHLAIYTDEMDQQGINVYSYYYGLLADALHNSHSYAKAEEMYEKYFDASVSEDNLTRSNIFLSEYKELYGGKLYNYAYNFFFQGKEEDGMEQLYLAKKCGNESAAEDYKILSSCPTFAVNIEYKKSAINEIQTTLEQLDIYDSQSNNNPSAFWNGVQTSNASLIELNTALKKEKRPGTLETALNQLGTQQSLTEFELCNLNPLDTDELGKYLVLSLCGDEPFLKELRIFPKEEANAFATPYGHIYLTTGLITKYHFNKNLLLGVCAHEVAHYICKHQLVALWKQAKKEKKNRILAGISAGLNTAVQGAAAMYGASSGMHYDDSYWESVKKNNNDMIQSFQEKAYYFQFKYGRSQEIESDIIAYRFLEHIGIGGYAYIMALQLLSGGDPYEKISKDSDHPTTNFRVGLLKYLYSKEHTTNNE